MRRPPRPAGTRLLPVEASGKAFDAAFLQMTAARHRDTAAMAETKKTAGSYVPVKDLCGAEVIAASQGEEIDQMNAPLGARPPCPGPVPGRVVRASPVSRQCSLLAIDTP
ncbi:DUF305 domain-containing protein [Streptosporangium sp. NPDC002544]|uniref:DUF305 domain-containing protein n=1 Tax=Streptosporangium sp. NPDC002544 TaxID=3154538 RepID=UPI00332ADFE2